MITEEQLIEAACDESVNGRHPTVMVLNQLDYFELFKGDSASFAVPWGLVTVVPDRCAPVGSVHWLTDTPALPKPISPLQFEVGRPRDPNPPEHLELTLTSLTAAEELIGQLQVAARKLMLGQPKTVTIVQGRLVPHGNR